MPITPEQAQDKRYYLVDLSHPDANTLLEDMGNQHRSAMKALGSPAEFSTNKSDDGGFIECVVLTDQAFRDNMGGHPAITEMWTKESHFLLRKKFSEDDNWENVRFSADLKPAGGWTSGLDLINTALRFLGIIK